MYDVGSMNGCIKTPQFLVDENVSGMTKWLRFLGFDTVTARGWSDIQVAEHANSRGRILITRDRELAESMNNEAVIHVNSDSLVDQLLTVLKKVGVTDHSLWFQRCGICNTPLRLLSEQELQTDDRFPRWIKDGDRASPRAWSCEDCGRAYWKGSHYDRTYRFLEQLQ